MVDINAVYLKAFRIYRQNFVTFAILTLLPMVILLPGLHIIDAATQQFANISAEDPAKLAPEQQIEIGSKLLQALLQASSYLIAGFILSMLFTGAIVAMARESNESSKPSKIQTGLDIIKKKGLSLMGGLLLASILGITGLMFFIIPGIIAYFFLMFVAQAIVIDGSKAVESLGKSFNFVKSEMFTSFMLLLLQIIYFTSSALISTAIPEAIAQNAISLALGVLFTPFIQTSLTVAYLERKQTEELLKF